MHALMWRDAPKRYKNHIGTDKADGLIRAWGASAANQPSQRIHAEIRRFFDLSSSCTASEEMALGVEFLS